MIVNRRLFLGSVGAVLSTGTLAYTTRQPPDTLEVRFWLSAQATEYRDVATQVQKYLEAVLAFEHWTLEVSHGGTVEVSTEDGGQVTRRGEWPAALVAGRLTRRERSAAPDVNLLVTDGQMRDAPTGYGFSNVASKAAPDTSQHSSRSRNSVARRPKPPSSGSSPTKTRHERCRF